MRIAILGTRGIPNHYGGFEQCAEYLALGLTKRGFDVSVYNSHNHPYKKPTWNGVKIIYCYDPEYKWGTIGQFIYDLNCILDLRKRKPDIILQLGYTSSSIWGSLLPKGSIVTTNMDGLEWKRTKYSEYVKRFLRHAEKLGVKYSDHLISDSIGIQEYLKSKYDAASTYIPYGANAFNNPEQAALAPYNVQPYNYDMIIARLEPENSIEIILDGVVAANTGRTMLVVGKHATEYGSYLKNKFAHFKSIVFVGGIYNIDILNNLRYYSNIYFHGHTVGGTNPSLLEAMASHSFICANDNNFNRFILQDDAVYFTNANDVSECLLKQNSRSDDNRLKISNNVEKVRNIYSWETITQQYADHFTAISELKRSGK